MKCPACQKSLREKGAGEFTLDMCFGGCGGLWFDAAELKRVNAIAAATLHTIWKSPSRVSVTEGPRLCPRCPEQVLDRKWFSDAKKVEIDQCPKCNGIWLDDGEFTKIYEETKGNKVGSTPLALAIAEAVAYVKDHPDVRDEPASA